MKLGPDNIEEAEIILENNIKKGQEDAFPLDYSVQDGSKRA